jgi:hypothetical protein
MVARDVPATVTVPLVGVSRPAIRCNRVLFPEPLAPVMATNSPGAISKLT